MLGTKRQRQKARELLRERHEQSLPVSVQAYINLMRDPNVVERFQSQIRPLGNPSECASWSGAHRFRVKGSDRTFSPHLALLYSVCAPDWRIERASSICETSNCFNTDHYSVLSLEAVNWCRFEAGLVEDRQNSGCLVRTGSSKFKYLTALGESATDPRKFLVGSVFKSKDEQLAFYFTCSNDACLNREHLARRATPVENWEDSQGRFFLELDSVIGDVYSRPLGSECISLTDSHIERLGNTALSVSRRASFPFSYSPVDASYIARWRAATALMFREFGFFAYPSGFSALGEVSVAMRRKFECKLSTSCINPRHRVQYLTKALEKESKPGFRYCKNEDRLTRSLNLTPKDIEKLEN